MNRPAPTAPPVAPRQPRDVSVHGDPRNDDYFWLRDRDDPRTLAYLKAENAYADAWLAPHAELKEKLYQEMLSRIQQDDDSVPMRKGDWWYSTQTRRGEQYPHYLRRRAVGPDRRYDPSGVDETLLDLNELARGQPFLRLGLTAVTRDATRLAYTTDLTGGRDYTLHVKDLATGAVDPWSVAEVSSAAWANDGRTLYYVTMDETKRANRLWRHAIGSAGADELPARGGRRAVRHRRRQDARRALSPPRQREQGLDRVAGRRCRQRRRRAVRAAHGVRAPRRRRVRPRAPRRPLLRAHQRHRAQLPPRHRRRRSARPGDAEELIAARDHVMLDDVDVFAGHLAVTERVAGSLQLRVIDLASGDDHAIAFDEPAYSVHTSGNAEFETTTLRFVYTSLTTPASTYDYDLATRERVLRKRQPVPGYDPSLYASERIFAVAGDGTEVPISLVYRKDARRAGAQPLLLYGYGSYGIPIDAAFSQSRVSLLDRGVVFAIGHIRGGGDLGRSWYEAGKMARKQTTFDDFIACAEKLIAAGRTTPAMLAIEGGSAGGLLMGAVVNQRPELFRAVVAQVPFVDVVTTMLDETMPLTVGEFIEWGNPKIAEQYAWMRAYSPYDNLAPGPYPAMLVRTGLNDTQVAYWEPAKYVARLRTLKTDQRPLLLKINLEVGHGGASGRFDALREIAEDDVFLLAELGLAG